MNRRSKTMIRLIDKGDGTYQDAEFDAVWTRTDYMDECSESCEVEDCEGSHPDTCTVCNDYISGEHYVCLDGCGDTAHFGCVTFHWHVVIPIKTILEIRAKYPEITELPLT